MISGVAQNTLLTQGLSFTGCPGEAMLILPLLLDLCCVIPHPDCRGDKFTQSLPLRVESIQRQHNPETSVSGVRRDLAVLQS